MDLNNIEVTLRVESIQNYRDFDGVQRTRIKFRRLARVKYDDKQEAEVPVEINVLDGPRHAAEAIGVTAFFIEAADLRDNGDGSLVHEVVAEGDI